MNGIAGLLALFVYVKIYKLARNPVASNGELQQGHTASLRVGPKKNGSHPDEDIVTIDEDPVEGTSQYPEQNRNIRLDLNDIDLKSFAVEDENYGAIFTKNIELKDPTKLVSIVEGDVIIHEPKNGETFISCTLRANDLDVFLRYEYRDASAKLKSATYYKADGNWYTLPTKPFGDNKTPFFQHKKCHSESGPVDGSKPTEAKDSADLSDFTHSVEALYIKFELDINSKREDDKVNFRKCYIHDNHSLVYIVRNGYKATAIKDGETTVCAFENGLECFYAQVLLVNEDPKLMITLSKDKGKVKSGYYEKVNGAWNSITSQKYYNDSHAIKKTFETKTDMELDIRTRTDTKEVLFIDSDYDDVHTHIFAPMPGYTFNKVKIKDCTIWEKKETECQMVLVRFFHNFPNKIQLIMPSGVSDEFYDMKKKAIGTSVRKRAKSTPFEGEWNKIDEERYSNDIAPIKMRPPIKFESNKFVLDINTKVDNEIYMFRHSYPMGVESYIYMAKDGYKIAMIKDGDEHIWKSASSEFGSFVVVFLSDKRHPILLRLVTFDHDIQSKHYYYIKLDGKWNEITLNQFRVKSDRLYTIINSLKTQNNRDIDVDLNKNYGAPDFTFIRYPFDGMDTKILIPNGQVKIQKVSYDGRVIWERKRDQCCMIICRLKKGYPYFLNIVKPGDAPDEFFYVSTFNVRDDKATWRSIKFDHIYVQIKDFMIKPYIQHSYKEYQLDIGSSKNHSACLFKTGDFYNIPSNYYIMKSGHGITKVVDEKREIWRAKNGEYSPYVIVHKEKNKPSLIFILVIKPTFEIDENNAVYFEKKEGIWVPMFGDVEFNVKLNKIEVIKEDPIKFSLEINYKKDDDRVMHFSDEMGLRNTILYFPRKEYRLVKLLEGEKVILETGDKDYMISVRVFLVNDNPYLLRVRYRHDDMSFKQFEKVGNEWIQIDSYSYLIKTLTLNDVFSSEVNVVKSSLFNKLFTRLGTDTVGLQIDESSFGSRPRFRFEFVDRDLSLPPIESIFGIISDKIKTERKESPSTYLMRDSGDFDPAVLDIININLNRFSFTDNIYKKVLHHVIDVNYGYKVTKVVEGELDIHSIRDDEELFRCHVYHKEGSPDLVDIFIYDSNRRLTYYIYTKRDGKWAPIYLRQSDLLYRLYRYLSRPVKKHLPLDLGFIDTSNFQTEEKRFVQHLHRTVAPNSDVSVTKVTFQNRLIKKLERTQTLIWASYNQVDGDSDVLDLFITDLDGKLICYSYKRDITGWKLSYSHESKIAGLREFSKNRFKSLVNHKLVNTCDGEILDGGHKEEVVLDLSSQEPTFEYTLDDLPCKMFRPRKNQAVTRVVHGSEEVLGSDSLDSKSLLAAFMYFKEGAESALYTFLVDDDGNVERLKYYRVGVRWTRSDLLSPFDRGVRENVYELDNITDDEVVEYLDDAYNCKFAKDLEETISRSRVEVKAPTFYKTPLWTLNLNNVDTKKFRVKRLLHLDKDCYEIVPNTFVLVDRLTFGDEIVHDLYPGELLDRVTVCVDDDDEFEITIDIEGVDGMINTVTRHSTDKDAKTQIIYNRTHRSLYRAGNLYQIAGTHVINIANPKPENFEVETHRFRGHLVKKFTLGSEKHVTRIFEGVRLINIAKHGHKIVGGCIFYKKGPAIMVINSVSPEGTYHQSLYVKVGLEWMLVKNYELSKYLRKTYSDREVVTDGDIAELSGYLKLKVDEPEEDDADEVAHGFEHVESDASTDVGEKDDQAEIRLSAGDSLRIADSLVLNVVDIHPVAFRYTDNIFIYNNAMHRAVEVNHGFRIPKVVEGELDIHKIKGGEELFRCVIYLKGDVPDPVDIFIYDSNRRLTYYKYRKVDGAWKLVYFRRSDLMYRLYRHMSRPRLKQVPLELGYVDNIHFNNEENVYPEYVHRSISPKPDTHVTKLTYQNRLIKKLTKTETLAWASFYRIDRNSDMLDLFITEHDGKLICYSYRRNQLGWRLTHTHESKLTKLKKFSSNMFKSLVNHKLVNTCDGEILDGGHKEEVVLDLSSQEPTFEYTLDDLPCKMFRPRKNQAVTRVVHGSEEVLGSDSLDSKSLLAAFMYFKEGAESALYTFLVDDDGNVERLKYYRVGVRWVKIDDSVHGQDSRVYELDNISDDEVVDYLDVAFNCKVTSYEDEEPPEPERSEHRMLRTPLWILDLNDVNQDKYEVSKFNNEGRYCTEVVPGLYVFVDRLMYRGEIVHDLYPGELLDRVTVCVDDDDEFEITIDIEGVDGMINTVTRHSTDKDAKTQIIYNRTHRSLYRAGNLYQIAGTHVINIANLRSENCTLKAEVVWGNYLKRFVVKPEARVTRIFEGVKLIGIAKRGYSFVAGIVYHNKGPAMVLLKATSGETVELFLYVKVRFEWMSVDNKEIAEYLKNIYPDGKYFTDSEIEKLTEL